MSSSKSNSPGCCHMDIEYDVHYERLNVNPVTQIWGKWRCLIPKHGKKCNHNCDSQYAIDYHLRSKHGVHKPVKKLHYEEDRKSKCLLHATEEDKVFRDFKEIEKHITQKHTLSCGFIGMPDDLSDHKKDSNRKCKSKSS